MTYREASVYLIKMVAELRNYGQNVGTYAEAVALANGVLYVAEVGDLCGDAAYKSSSDVYDLDGE